MSDHNPVEYVKAGLDVTAAGATLGALLDHLPVGVTILTGLYTAIRLYETKTVQKLLAQIKGHVQNLNK